MKINETNTYKKLVSKKADSFPTRILVHHSGGTDANALEDTSHHTAQIMETWHLKLGWIGLGYHYVIHKDGSIWAGRPENYHAAHEPSWNGGLNKDGSFKPAAIGICLSGNFDATLPTKAQEESLKWLVGDIKTRYKIEAIEPHRSYANKTCYGTKLSDTWASDLCKEEEEVVDDVELVKCKDTVAEQKSLIQAFLELIVRLLNK